MELTASKYTKQKGRKIGGMFYLFMLFLIMGSDSLLFLYNRDHTPQSIFEIAFPSIAIIAFIICIAKKTRTIPKPILLLVGIVAWIVVIGIYHSEFSGGYILKVAGFLFGFSFFSLVDADKFEVAFENVMFVICIASLIGFALSSVIIQLPFPKIFNTSLTTHEFKSLLLTNVSTLLTYRNYGLFTEPSRFQAFINLYIIFLMFSKNKRHRIHLIIAIITLVTTFSTTGFVAFSLIILAYMVSAKEISFEKKILIFIVVIFTTIILFNVNEYFAKATNKLFMGENSVSFTVRYNSIVANLKMIAEYPLFGVGISRYNQIFVGVVSSFSNVRDNYTNTNTILMTFSKFGLFIGVYYVWNLIKSLRKLVSGLSCVLLFIAFFAFTSGISLIDSVVFNMFIFYHMRMLKVDALEKEKYNEHCVYKPTLCG